MLFEPYHETLPLPQLRALQKQRLLALLRYVNDRVPFYKDQWRGAGIDISAVGSTDDLYKLPFIKKSDLRNHYPFGMFAVPAKEVIRIHASTGTTGKPTIVGYTKKDLEIFAEVNARSLMAGGAKPGMKLQNAYGYGLFTGGLGLHYGAERLGMTVIPVSGGMTDRQIMLLLDLQAEVMSCTPSYALLLAEEIRNRGIDPHALPLKYMLLGAEPWTETVREEVQQSLQVIATNIYGLSEVIGPGVAQEDFEERGSGSYVWEDHFFPEIVHPETGEPLPEGAYGVLVLTTLTKQAMPLIRYWTNDITNLHYDRGAKRTMVKMGPVRGRADDMLIIRGVNLFHTQIEAVISDVPELAPHYQLVVTREGAMDAVEVLVELHEPLYHAWNFQQDTATATHEKVQALAHFLSKKIKDNTGLSMKVSIQPYHTVPRSEGGKLNHINDLRKVRGL